ncbi:MAG TPA: glycosyltransferase family 9 protein [Desulfobacterales bacterium]|nr:glycosyltransferase family 9 protein [Desulfobacterales bacterium]
MELAFPGLCFLTSSVPLKFNTDGHSTLFEPSVLNDFDPEHILVLTDIHVQLFGLTSVQGVSLFNSIAIPEDFKVPQIYDGTQDLGGKRVLILMLNGWGDMILIQPALRSFFKKANSSGAIPKITIACNWIDNFPYPNAQFIQEVRPNIMTLKELSKFDLLVNLIHVNHQRSANKSMKDVCLEILKLSPGHGNSGSPCIVPDFGRVRKIKPVIDQIRKQTGKKLLCVNWRSRFPHKNASPALFSNIANQMSDKYHALLFKDAEVAEVMQKEIEDFNIPITNLSSHISDYHDTIALLSLVDAFISVDTGIVHAAGAIGIPGVALFGPFPPATHISDYPSVIGIRTPYKGKTCNGPCLETHRGCAEVDFSNEKISPCFEAIPPDFVFEAFEKAINLSKTR